jgi:hypothetical protein
MFARHDITDLDVGTIYGDEQLVHALVSRGWQVVGRLLSPGPRAYTGRMHRDGEAGGRGWSGAEIAEAEQAILSTLAAHPDAHHPPTPRALQQAARAELPPELLSAAFWRLVQSGRLVFDGNARVKFNDIPPRG